MMVDFFAFSLNHRCGVYFAPVSDSMAAGTDTMPQSWDFIQGYAFPPFSLIPQVLHKLRVSREAVITVLATVGMVSGSSGTAPGSSSSAREVGPPAAASCSQISSAIILASSSYVETVQRFAMAFYCQLGLWCHSLLLGTLTRLDLRFP